MKWTTADIALSNRFGLLRRIRHPESGAYAVFKWGDATHNNKKYSDITAFHSVCTDNRLNYRFFGPRVSRSRPKPTSYEKKMVIEALLSLDSSKSYKTKTVKAMNNAINFATTLKTRMARRY
jgi:hypothetical protein